jgi:multiple antibiotic resistance protein
MARITRHHSPESRRRAAIRGVVIAAAILIAFIVVGQILLEALGITLPSFSIADGLVLLAISLQRVLTTENIQVDEEAKSSGEVRHVSVFPLATPYIAGPASILAAVLLTDNQKFGFVEQAQTTLVMLFILALTCAVLLAARTVQRLLGATDADVISRISGLILAALAVETILQGIRASF